jgi:carboxypeptidase family protein
MKVSRFFPNSAVPLVLIVLIVLLVLQPTRAAAQTGSITGVVVDDSGAALPGAMVILTSDTSTNPRETAADATGKFVFANVAPGDVRIHAELAGFQPLDIKVKVTTEAAASVVARMKVGFDEEVTVSAEAQGSVLSPTRNANAVEFDPEALRRLPTESQDLQTLVENFTAAGPFGHVSVVVDGSETDSAGIPTAAIHRLIINRNPYSAEFKSPGKSRVEVETERGSRRYYHGSGAVFLRNSALDARNAFAASTPDMSRALNEGSLSGPLLHKGWSFFLTAQQLIDNASAIVNAQTAAGPVLQNVPTPERRNTLFGRVDFRPNKTDAVTIRYDLFDDSERDHGIGGFRLAEQAYSTTERRHRVQANDHRVVSDGVLNDLRVEAVHRDRVDGGRAVSPAIVVAGAFTSGASQIFSNDAAESLQAQDTVSLTIAAHPVRIGGRVKARWNDLTDASNFGGTYRFRSLTDYDRRSPFLFVQRSGNPTATYGEMDSSVFVESSFRPAESVGLTIGARYDWQSAIDDWNNIAPRAAVAFAPAGRKTVFRAGAGVFYQSVSDDAIARARLFGDGGLREIAVSNPSYPATPVIAATAPAASWTLAPDVQMPAVLQTSVSAERALWRKTSLTAEYTMLRSSNALRAIDINAPLPGTGVRPDRTRLNLFQIQSTGTSRTDAVSATFRGRLAGFRGTIQYTLARALDDASDVFALPADSYNLAAEHGRADFDRRHRFNVAGAYGWMHDRVRLGAVLAMYSGAPYDIVTGTDTNRDLVANDRPAGVTRNSGEGPGYAQLDLRLTTVFRAPRPPSADPESAKREQTDNFELNLDLFNATNRVNPTTYVGVITSPLFGQANTARPARSAQLSFRYRF